MANNKKDLDKEINAITLKIKRGTWECFKMITPRNVTLNEAITQLILKEINKNSKPATPEEIEEFDNPKRGRPANRYVLGKK